jgi:Leucine-rich repeat (LRR) protein
MTSTQGLERLQALEELDLSGNNFDHITHLGQLQRLQRLDLSNTGIESLAPILALGDIEVLRLQGDLNLTCDDIAQAIAEFGELAVRYDRECPSLSP